MRIAAWILFVLGGLLAAGGWYLAMERQVPDLYLGRLTSPLAVADMLGMLIGYNLICLAGYCCGVFSCFSEAEEKRGKLVTVLLAILIILNSARLFYPPKM